MSVEGMWAIYFGHVQSPSEVAGSGIIILETERLFGGDSYIAYEGGYAVDGPVIKGEARTWSYGPFPTETVFGQSGPVDVKVHLEGTIATGAAGEMVINASLWSTDDPDRRIGAFMRKIAELPG